MHRRGERFLCFLLPVAGVGKMSSLARAHVSRLAAYDGAIFAAWCVQVDFCYGEACEGDLVSP